MSDLQLDLSDLRLAKARVTTSLTTFQEAGRVGEDISGYTGEDRLRGKVRDFADNWDYNRGKLQEQLEFLRDALEAVVTSMEEVDAELERAAQEAAPETETSGGDGGDGG